MLASPPRVSSGPGAKVDMDASVTEIAKTRQDPSK